MPNYSSTNGRPSIGGQVTSPTFSLSFPSGNMPSIGNPSLSQLMAQRQVVWNEQQRLTDRMVEVLAVLTGSTPPNDADDVQESWSHQMAPLWMERQQLRRQLESIETREQELATRIQTKLSNQIVQAQSVLTF